MDEDWLRVLISPGLEEAEVRNALLSLAEGISRQGCWAWFRERGQIIWSEGLYRLHDIPVGDPVTLSTVVDRIHPADRERMSQRIQRISAGDQPPEVTYRALLPGGVVRHFSSLPGTPMDGAGQVLVGCIRDITETLGAEREMACHSAVAEVFRDWSRPETDIVMLIGRLAEALGFSRGTLWTEGEGDWRISAQWCAPGVGQLDPRRGQGAGRPLTMAAKLREPILIDSLLEHPEFKVSHELRSEGRRGAAVMPLISGLEVLAVMTFSVEDRLEVDDRLYATLMGLGYEIGAFLSSRASFLRSTVLSPREIEILRLASQGRSGPEIAADLFVSPATVKTHFENIYGKYDVPGRSAAVAKAIREGVFS